MPALFAILSACAEVAPSLDTAPAAIDSIFLTLASPDSPGCSVAAMQDGREVLARAFGTAELEQNMPITPETVFEAGSVSKQFVAAATILLALDGRISLEDDIAKFLPELPDYGEVIRVRDLLNHTNGMRDWGSIAGIHGWQRTTRRHTHTHVLELTARQSALNYPVGAYYSYTNTGYNLLSVIVERVTGRSLDDFSQERIFGPLGMTRTQWRDDFTEVVPNRAMAYRRAASGDFHQLMPFENVYGNGGLLTTPSDLLRFTNNLETGAMGGPEFIEEMHRRGVVGGDREIKYASALIFGEHRGVPEVHHAGGTAGYSAFLTRFPEQGVGVAVMCNVTGSNPRGLAHSVADVYLSDAIDDRIPDGLTRPPAQLESFALDTFAGGYRDTFTGRFFEVVSSEGRLIVNNVPLVPVNATRFEGPSDFVLEFDARQGNEGRPDAHLMSQVLDRARLEPVDTVEPSSLVLGDYVGEYYSDDAEVTYWIELDGDQLRSRQRYDVTIELTPAYQDAFTGFGATFIFHRDGSGRVTEFSMTRDRVWDLDFERRPVQ